jgi:hypothetical protein
MFVVLGAVARLWAADCGSDPGTALWAIQVRATTPKLTVVDGLSAGNFTVRLAGKPQQICRFEHLRTPVSIGIVWDTSGSMGGDRYDAMGIVRAGAERLLDHAGPEDEFFLQYANESPSAECEFTRNLARLRAGLNVSPKGKTALLDALYAAASGMRKARHFSQGIVIFSDGADNSSVYSDKEIASLLEGLRVPIYLLAPRNPRVWAAQIPRAPEEIERFRSLYRFTIKSGGYAIGAARGSEMATAVTELARSLQWPYGLYFRGPQDDGKLVVETQGLASKPVLAYRGGRVVTR